MVQVSWRRMRAKKHFRSTIFPYFRPLLTCQKRMKSCQPWYLAYFRIKGRSNSRLKRKNRFLLSRMGGTMIAGSPNRCPAQASVRSWSPRTAVFPSSAPMFFMASRSVFFPGFPLFGYASSPSVALNRSTRSLSLLETSASFTSSSRRLESHVRRSSSGSACSYGANVLSMSTNRYRIPFSRKNVGVISR